MGHQVLAKRTGILEQLGAPEHMTREHSVLFVAFKVIKIFIIQSPLVFANFLAKLLLQSFVPSRCPVLFLCLFLQLFAQLLIQDLLAP